MSKPIPTPTPNHLNAVQSVYEANHELIIGVAAILIAGAIVGLWLRFRDWTTPRIKAGWKWLVEHRPYVTLGPPPKASIEPPAPQPQAPPQPRLDWKVHVDTDPNGSDKPIEGKRDAGEIVFYLPIHVTNTGTAPSKSFDLLIHFGPPFSVRGVAPDGYGVDTRSSDFGNRWWTFELPSRAMLQPGETRLLGFARLAMLSDQRTKTTAYWQICSQPNRYYYPSHSTFGELHLTFNWQKRPPPKPEDSEQPSAPSEQR